MQYSLKVWLTSALAVPHVYLLYYAANAGSGAGFPISGYIELLIICLLLSLPVWLIFLITLDAICRTGFSIQAKKALSLVSFEVALLLLFTVVIHFGDRYMSWVDYFDFIFICCFTAAVCILLYKLQPLQGKSASA